MKLRRHLHALLSGLLLGMSLAAQAAQPLSVAVVPQFPPERIFRDWSPVLSELEKLTGLSLELKIYASIPEFESAFLKGAPDIAYMNPYHAVMAHKAAGYIPIIRDEAEKLTGILLVRKDSPITRLDQLDGASLAFPAPNAFGASLYMRALLSEEARIRFTPSYVKTHSNVYRHILLGKVAAGGSIGHALEKENPEIGQQMRVLYETPPANPHPVVVHPRTGSKTREALQQAFLKLAARPDFADRLKAIQIARPGKAAYPDYAPLEKLGLERYIQRQDD